MRYTDRVIVCPEYTVKLNPTREWPSLLLLPVAVALFLTPNIQAQELEPRALSPNPVGLNFAVVHYGYSTGNVFFDKSLPVEDATGILHSLSLGYVRTMSVGGVPVKLSGMVPFAWGDWEGLWQDAPTAVSRRGFADPTVDLAVTLIGAPAMRLRQLSTYNENLIVGASLTTIVPLGQYNPEKLINLGSNRWAIRTRLGASKRMGKWIVESVGSVWFFTENSDAFGNTSITQDPVLWMQFNAVRLFKRGFWAGAGFGYGEGGRTTVSGQEKDNRQVNRLFGVTMIYPLDGRNSLKANFTSSQSAAIGADFDRFALMWLVYLGGGN